MRGQVARCYSRRSEGEEWAVCEEEEEEKGKKKKRRC